jgi:sugar phosphate isomerase/epimerase
MIPCFSTVTTLASAFIDDLDASVDAACPALELWLTKLEAHVERHGLTATRQQLHERGLQVAAAAYQGGLLLSEGEARREQVAQFTTRLELCQGLGIPLLLILPDFAEQVQPMDLQRAVRSLTQVAQAAAAHDIRLALEFRPSTKWCGSVATAAALVETCGEPNVGLCLDLFHYYTGPSKFEDLERLTMERLFHVQVCDLVGVPRELASDADRVLPGDGDFQIKPILDLLSQRGYTGAVSVELMNPTIWQMKTVQVMEIAVTSVRRLLGQATMESASRNPQQQRDSLADAQE